MYANDDADRALPLDVLREFEEQGIIGKLHDYMYTTVGNGTSVANSKKICCRNRQRSIGCGSAGCYPYIYLRYLYTLRCNDDKEIERTGLPVVHMCTVVPISLTDGANRIIPSIAIPHPLGNPALAKEEETALRRKLVWKALDALTQPVDGQTVFDK